MTNLALVQNIFFFLLLFAASFLMWKIFAPFWGVLALAAIIVTICYPIHRRVQERVYRKNGTLASFVSLVMVLAVVIFPLTIIGSLLLREAVSVYSLFNDSSYASFTASLGKVEAMLQVFVPEFTLDIGSVVAQVATFLASHLVSIFAGTASTIFYFFLALIATFYFFRDGAHITKYLIKLSPLKDGEDSIILNRLATSVRSVALGTVLVALIQGVLTSVGLWLFGFDRAILWGTIAAIGALVPGVGTAIVLIPAIIYLLATGSFLYAGGLALWAFSAVGLIDNILGPYLMSRGNPLHPFVILLSVLGGIALMGPIGFILGPVIASLFTVLIELFASHVKQ
jgi:predicted PurR-regulated permease PerM